MLTLLATVLLFSLCASLVCVAINNVLERDNMLLSQLGETLLLTLPLWASKVLFACLPCMSSFWGSTLWIVAIIVSSPSGSLVVDILLLVPAVLMVSGFNIILGAIVEACLFNTERDHDL